MKISIIIGSLNQRLVLEKTLYSLFYQTTPPSDYEIIVADSSSTDGTKEWANSLTPPCNFQFLSLQNKGKAHARNQGISHAKADIILITDADMIAKTNLIEEHLKAHQKSKTPSCYEGLTYNLKKLAWPTTSENIEPYIKRNYPAYAKLGWFYFLTGNLSLPKKLFEEMNGFSEEFIGYGWEDIELGYRLAQKKIPLFYLKSAINYHYHVVEPSKQIDRNFDKGVSAKIVLKKHPELKLFLGINPVSVGIYRLLKKKPKIYNWLQNQYKNPKNKVMENLSFYILGEYQYLDGLLTDLKR